MNIKEVLIYDIETAPYYDDTADKNLDKLRFVGFRLPNGQKLVYEYPQQKIAIQNTLSSYKYVAGHNILDRVYNGLEMGYDNAIMKRSGFKFKTFNKQDIISFDTQQLLEKRGRSMMYIKLAQGQYSLRYLTEYFNLVDDSNRKGDFDYLLLRKPFLTPLERKELTEYLHRDLESTYKLFEYLWNTFSGIQHNLSPLNQRNGKWLTGASGTTAYRWYCNVKNIPEVYDWDIERWSIKAALMDVDESRDKAKNILVFDFNSLYPTMERGNNLDERVPIEHVDKEKLIDKRNGRPLWHGGNEVFSSIEDNPFQGIQGYYYHDEVSSFDKKLEEKFFERKEVKKKYKETHDKKYYYEQLGIKILMNSFYGAKASAPFVNMADRISAEDITRSAQSCIRHARKYFEDRGYWIIYLHTDSLYVVDVYNNPEKVKAIAREITEIQNNAFNIPTRMHNFDYEKSIDTLWTTRSDDGTILKQRNFIVYTKDGVKKAGFTGGKLADFNTSLLSKKIWKDVISQDLINGKSTIYYSLEQLFTMIKTYAKQYPELLQIRKKVKGLDHYKTTSSQQYKISNHYGSGEHLLVPNKYLGVSNSTKKKYLCKKEELVEAFGNQWLEAVDYSKYLLELSVFVRLEDRKNLYHL